MSGHAVHRRGCAARRTGTGLTLIELMVVIVVVGVLALVAVPSVRDLILMQRLRSINAQLVTDLQFARSEAVRRGEVLRVVFREDAGRTCYALFTSPGNGIRCDCLNGAGSACALAAGAVEVRTVVVQRSLGVTLLPGSGEAGAFGFQPSTGGLIPLLSDLLINPPTQASLEARIDDARRLRTVVNLAGRLTVCAPNAAAMQVPACT
jgi:type IV fimbrial biogenesis protein FimT